MWLDAAAAKAEGLRVVIADGVVMTAYGPRGDLYGYSPSTNWLIAGPIIERERISVTYWGEERTHPWSADMPRLSYHILPASGWADSPLTAACRAFVASKFGDEVDLQEPA